DGAPVALPCTHYVAAQGHGPGEGAGSAEKLRHRNGLRRQSLEHQRHQGVLGALTRHLIRADWVLPHILGAIVVGGVAVWTAARAVGIYEDLPAVRGSGLALVFLVILQLFLGFFALAFPQNPAPSSGTSGSLESLVTTGHQATGALVLSVVVVHLLRVWRLVGEPAPEAPAA
ncbi:MAG: hypothetical protein ACO4B3_10795, partial [Planctomycetota bacterium]